MKYFSCDMNFYFNFLAWFSKSSSEFKDGFEAKKKEGKRNNS